LIATICTHARTLCEIEEDADINKFLDHYLCHNIAVGSGLRIDVKSKAATGTGDHESTIFISPMAVRADLIRSL